MDRMMVVGAGTMGRGIAHVGALAGFEVALSDKKEGMVAGALERWPLAVEQFRQALRLDPEYARASLFLARSLAESGRFSEARDALARAAKLGIEATDLSDARSRLELLQRGSE